MRVMRSGKAESVDDYLKVMPEDARVALEKLRKVIKAAAPETTEVISYRIPIFQVLRSPLGRFWRNREQLFVLRYEFEHDSQAGTSARWRVQGVRRQRRHHTFHA